MARDGGGTNGMTRDSYVQLSLLLWKVSQQRVRTWGMLCTPWPVRMTGFEQGTNIWTEGGKRTVNPALQYTYIYIYIYMLVQDSSTYLYIYVRIVGAGMGIIMIRQPERAIHRLHMYRGSSGHDSTADETCACIWYAHLHETTIIF